MFGDIEKIVRQLPSQSDTDFVSRLNSYYTVALLAMVGAMLTASQYVGNPIQCWVEQQFTDPWEEYVESYCFAEGVYYVPVESTEMSTDPMRKNVYYYPWVPFVFLIEAIMFYLPFVVWQASNTLTGLQTNRLVKTALAVDPLKTNYQSRLKDLALLLQNANNFDETGVELESRSVKLTICFLGVKLLQILNVFIQFPLLQFLLGISNSFWGLVISKNFENEKSWQVTGNFPRVAFCDFSVKVVDNVHNYTTQCVLVINRFNEIIFFCLWWYLIALLIISIVSFLQWSFLLCQRESLAREWIRSDRNRSIISFANDIEDMDHFVKNHISSDTMLAFLLIRQNIGNSFYCERMIQYLWTNYQIEKYQTKSGNSSLPVSFISGTEQTSSTSFIELE